ncbi:MAG: heme o synthase [Parvularculales bacterium]
MSELSGLLPHPKSRSGESYELGMGSAADYFYLLKPRVMSLVVFTALVGLLMAPVDIHPVIGCVALLCIAVGAGAAGSLNMWYDADIDATMVRTRARPIPAGRITPGEALGFGATLSVGSVAFMGLLVNVAAAFLLAFTIAFYLFVYTMWLKRQTVWNIVIGGVAGALPPVIGWVVTGAPLTLEPIFLFLFIFLWTPPHSWALALYRVDEYNQAAVPMLPVVVGRRTTRVQIVIYGVVLVMVTIFPWVMGGWGPVYGVGAVVLGLAFAASMVDVLVAGDGTRAPSAARRLFLVSIIYLFLLFTLILCARLFGMLPVLS